MRSSTEVCTSDRVDEGARFLPPPAASVTRFVFREACARFTTGIAVVTLVDESGVQHGVTVNSFTSVSLDPPLILFCLDRRSSVLRHMRAGEPFAVNVLGETQRHLSETFARGGEDRFERCAWRAGVCGAPVLAGVIALFECRLKECVEGGDHVILIGEVDHAWHEDGEALIYFKSSYRSLLLDRL